MGFWRNPPIKANFGGQNIRLAKIYSLDRVAPLKFDALTARDLNDESGRTLWLDLPSRSHTYIPEIRDDAASDDTVTVRFEFEDDVLSGAFDMAASLSGSVIKKRLSDFFASEIEMRLSFSNLNVEPHKDDQGFFTPEVISSLTAAEIQDFGGIRLRRHPRKKTRNESYQHQKWDERMRSPRLHADIDKRIDRSKAKESAENGIVGSLFATPASKRSTASRQSARSSSSHDN